MEHHDDVRTRGERRVVAGLLVAPVPAVLRVDDHVETEVPGDLDGLVAGDVVDEDDALDEFVRDVRVRPFERTRGVVRGHHDDESWGRRSRHRRDGHDGRVPDGAPPNGHGAVMQVCDDTGRPSVTRSSRTMFERLFGSGEKDPAVAERIPPGQYKTDKFPVLHYGSVPRVDLATWDFKVYGEVDSPFTLTWDQFKALPRKTVKTDIHCVTRWTKLDTVWEGVPIQAILEMAGVRPTATHVVSHAEQGYTANLPLSVLDDDDVLLADTFDGQPLELEHGYPLRLFVPKRYFWKSSKWVRGLEFLDHDQLGFWERYGYNNDADPWKEERFSE